MTFPMAYQVPSFNVMGGLSDDEKVYVGRMTDKLSMLQPSNQDKALYYEGEQRVQNMNIAIPDNQRRVTAISGWSGTVVDTLEERLDWEGWVGTKTDLGLGEIYRRNGMAVDSGMGHLDALIYGTSFVTVGAGMSRRDVPLITVESPTAMTGLYSPRTRLLTAAYNQRLDDDGVEVVESVLYLPNETIYMERNTHGSPWKIVDRDQHKLNRVPVAQFLNRPRAGRMGGRSEITKAVRYYTDMSIRTLEAMEVNREFAASPQRYVLGASEEAFMASDGSALSGWQAIQGAMLALDRDENGELPQVGQFPQASQGPYMDTIRGAAQLLAAECGIPASYLGFTTDNPASADAIRQAESRLIKRAERRQVTLGRGWDEVGRLSLLVRDGEIPDEYDTEIGIKWRDAATPTRSAAADEAVKLISAGVLTPDSTVTYTRIGLSDQDQRQIALDKARGGMTALLARLDDNKARLSPEAAKLASKRVPEQIDDE